MSNLPTGFRIANPDEFWANGGMVFDYDGDVVEVIVPLLPLSPEILDWIEEAENEEVFEPFDDDYGVVSPYDDRWESGYLAGSGENMYDDSYIDYLNN
jgi:hypothetical protein